MINLRKLLTRKRRDSLCPPPLPTPGGLAEAAAEAVRTGELMARVEARESEVEARSAHAAEIHRRNNLGPAFMRALGAPADRRTS